jgi:toluene monooxygenase system protein E
MSSTPQKTYWHLLGKQRIPSEYEIVSSRLLYYTGRGFEVKVPAAEWYQRYQRDSAWQCSDWERFDDPRETTYAAYTARRAKQETYVDGLLESIERSAHDRTLTTEWRVALERLFAPLLYPLHGLQMIASYVGQMAPSGRITIAALFQSADEVRRIQRIGYRLTQLQETWPELARNHKELWLHDAAWQPLREAVEHLLVTYDWGESFVGLNLCLKPALDELVTHHLANAARTQGDHPLAQMLGSLREDVLWQREWTHALVETVCADTPASRGAVQDWASHWSAVALRAVGALAAELDALDARAERGVGSLIEGEMRVGLAALDLVRPAAGAERSPEGSGKRPTEDRISH